MAVGPVDALVDEVLLHATDCEADTLRTEAVNLAFDIKLGPEELSSLLCALESRTGTKLERREGGRVNYIPVAKIRR